MKKSIFLSAILFCLVSCSYKQAEKQSLELASFCLDSMTYNEHRYFDYDRYSDFIEKNKNVHSPGYIITLRNENFDSFFLGDDYQIFYLEGKTCDLEILLKTNVPGKFEVIKTETMAQTLKGAREEIEEAKKALKEAREVLKETCKILKEAREEIKEVN